MKEKDFELPKYEVNKIVATYSQSMDWSLVYSSIPETWKVTEGEDITIAVIDTGLPQHLDIGENAIGGGNCIPSEDIYDYNGHQTHCVGIISAKNNEEGFVGVAPKSKCICIKALDKNGSGSFKAVAEAVEMAIGYKPDIISMSLGGRAGSQQLHDAVKRAHELNIPVVCAAGNSGHMGVGYPAAYEETIAVGAFDKNGKIASFSSRGKEVDWAAPGADIYSTFLENTYASLSGTSMACPFMAGIIALMLSKHKKQYKKTGKNDCKTVDEIKEHLLKYTNDRGTVGKDENWGYGVVDVKKLINEDDGSDIPHPYPTPEPKPEPKPTPSPSPEPTSVPSPPPTEIPEPTPTPTPTKLPDPIEKPKKKISVAWYVLGGFVIFCLGILAWSLFSEEEIPEPPYIDENGNVNWDMKFEYENQK